MYSTHTLLTYLRTRDAHLQLYRRKGYFGGQFRSAGGGIGAEDISGVHRVGRYALQ